MKYLLAEIEVPFRVAVIGAVFFAFFILMTIYVYSKRQKARYERIGELPLEDGIAVVDTSQKNGTGVGSKNG